MLNRFLEWLEGIRPPSEDVVIEFALSFGNLEIGRLKLENGLWEFQYSAAFQREVDLKPLTDFPDKARVYHNAELWPFFSQRIPSLQQPRVIEFMTKRKLKEVDQVTLLKNFGRRTIANPYKLEAIAA